MTRASRLGSTSELHNILAVLPISKEENVKNLATQRVRCCLFKKTPERIFSLYCTHAHNVRTAERRRSGTSVSGFLPRRIEIRGRKKLTELHCLIPFHSGQFVLLHLSTSLTTPLPTMSGKYLTVSFLLITFVAIATAALEKDPCATGLEHTCPEAQTVSCSRRGSVCECKCVPK
ncbi:hypothetical protein V5799_023960 [Amblyomma americanum]|uniref:Uncharacterized protein n=1 Tax=Amblyomma americanum TaxID=6943 RepID=A0AAQ4FGK3_AMBAM